jgi:hypothetical protein
MLSFPLFLLTLSPMAQHVLSLEAPSTTNKSILRLVDTSVYNTQIPVTCPTLEIAMPGFSSSITIPEVEPGFCNLVLTACDLGIQTVQCGTEYGEIPDGIYVIKWSVSPNDIVYVEYNHMRITQALVMIQNAYCNLDLGTCDPPVQVKDKLTELRLIQSMFEASKSYVEYCHNPNRGMQLYEYAMKRLKKFDCSPCKTNY